MSTPLRPTDRQDRPMGSLRVSVTDRCNMRCRYCMPEDSYVWLPRTSLLSFEEIERLVRVFALAGVDKIRLTGGEPLLRHDLPSLIGRIRRVPGIRDLALTTNGVLLERWARPMREAGLDRVTISLDTLRPERLREFARNERHDDILRGIAAARDAGYPTIKVNAVIIRDYNLDEVAELLAFGKANGLEVRFIEYMDVGGATRWSIDQVVSRMEILDVIGRARGRVTPLPGDPRAPAEQFTLSDGTRFGIVASTTAPFCGQCDRSRLTADGTWFLCLYAESGVDLRDAVRGGASDAELRDLVVGTWRTRTDRGAEARLGLADRGALYPVEALRLNPLREMHTRGG
ncbi:MAG: GTP 3',8-cyclase MoaA [Gemmatimonadales bacterium]|nr:MAG: GTP 3',8-cyclase MoaA [Gemmatimonadales bacterium]